MYGAKAAASPLARTSKVAVNAAGPYLERGCDINLLQLPAHSSSNVASTNDLVLARRIELIPKLKIPPNGLRPFEVAIDEGLVNYCNLPQPVVLPTEFATHH